MTLPEIVELTIEELKDRGTCCDIYLADDTPNVEPELILTYCPTSYDELMYVYDSITGTIRALGFTGEYEIMAKIGIDYYSVDYICAGG